MFVMVLNDQETYTDLSGCKIVEIPANVLQNEAELDEFVKAAATGRDPESQSVVREFGDSPS